MSSRWRSVSGMSICTPYAGTHSAQSSIKVDIATFSHDRCTLTTPNRCLLFGLQMISNRNTTHLPPKGKISNSPFVQWVAKKSLCSQMLKNKCKQHQPKKRRSSSKHQAKWVSKRSKLNLKQEKQNKKVNLFPARKDQRIKLTCYHLQWRRHP